MRADGAEVASLEQSLEVLRGVLDAAAAGKAPVPESPRSLAPEAAPLAEAIARFLARWRQVEEGARRNEEKCRRLANEVHAVIYAIDLHSGEIEVTMEQQMEVMLGFARNEWLADPTLLAQRLHPDDRERVLSSKAGALERLEPLTIEYRLLNRQGATVWIHDHATVTRDAAGVPVRFHGVAVNISARWHVEEALEKSEHRFERMANRLPDVMFRVGRGGLEYVSPASRAMLGRDADEMINHPDALAFVHPDDRARVRELMAKLEHGPVRFETRVLHADGRAVWVEENLVPVYDALGTMVAVEGIARDVSERKRIEAELRQSEDLFHTLAALAPVGIFRTDPDGRCTYVSEHWCTMAGMRPAEALGDGWVRGLHPDDRQPVAAQWYGTVRDRTPFQAEYRFQSPAGVTAWVVGRAFAETTASGEIRGYVGTITDITDRKLAEQALRESETRYRTIFENAAVSLWEEDCSLISERLRQMHAQGVDVQRYVQEHPAFVRWALESVKVLDVNQQSLTLFGAETKADLLNGLSGVFVPETMPAFAAMVIAIAEGRTSFRAEAPLRTLDGRRLDALVSIALPPETEPDAPALVSVVDITESKRAEQALLDAERAKRAAARAAADAERRRVARELHDGVLQDLTAVKLMIEAEHKRGGAGSLGAAVEGIARVIREVRIMADDLQPGDLTQGSFQDALGEHARVLARSAGIALTLELDRNAPLAPAAVRDLYRIAQEALANAVRHASPTRIGVRLRQRQQDAVLEIEDDGAGFDITSPNAGMGLSSMRERVAAVGGDLDISSAVGRGTIVRVVIPGRSEPAAPAVRASAPAASSGAIVKAGRGG